MLPHASKEATALTAFVSSLLADFNQLATALKGSKALAQMSHRVKNRVLLATEGDAKAVVLEVLGHLLHVAEVKGVHNIVLGVLGKVIGFAKVLERVETKESLLARNEAMGQVLYAVTDVVVLMKNHYRQPEVTLRIVQAAFSLVDDRLLQFANYNILTRLYSVCFECCAADPTVQNISVSAMFSLTELLFATNPDDSLLILAQMLAYLLHGKRFLWIKDRERELTGIVWDLVNVAVKTIPAERLPSLLKHRQIVESLAKMYTISAEKAFAEEDAEKSGSFSKSFAKEEGERNIVFKKGSIPDFMRFYKTFIYFSIHLHLKGSAEWRELIPFHRNLGLFMPLYDSARTSKRYLLLEGVSLLLHHHSSFLVEQEHGIILIDVFNKVCEELNRAQRPLEFSSDNADLYLERLCVDLTKIGDNDFLKIIKSTILRLRRSLEAESHTLQQKLGEEEKSVESAESDKPYGSLRKRWERLIKIVVRMVRNLTSLNLREGSNEQMVRKLVSELQYWFILCPTPRLRNLVLEELLAASSQLDSRLQSIRASQCLQVASNIIYGYSDALDVAGLALLLRMIAATQVSWLEGRGFDELEEVCIMTEKLYSEQQLVHSPHSFAKTLQAFALCLNGLLADSEQPTRPDSRPSRTHHRHLDRYNRIMDYVLLKIEKVLLQGGEYIEQEWDFLTGLWVSHASNKNPEVRRKILNHLLPIAVFLIKNTPIAQHTLMALYEELAKLPSLDVAKAVLSHLRQLSLIVTSEDAILSMFRTLSTMLGLSGVSAIHQQLYEFLETMIKECLFQVGSVGKLVEMVDHIGFISQDKGEEYKVVNLVWNVSDHLKTFTHHDPAEIKLAWTHIFQKIISLGAGTLNVETKQSCIHALTQILAESVAFIGQDLFLSILHHQYFEMFSLLMDFPNPSETHQAENPQAKTVNAELIRHALKNFIKITRKCLSISISVSRSLFVETLALTGLQLGRGIANQIEYLNELNVLLQYLQELAQTPQYEALNCGEEINLLMERIQQTHSSIDKSTYSWKKYSSAFQEIRVFFAPK